jgi:outer membrane protein TolC
MPRLTLEEVLDRATLADPAYVAASRGVADAAWERRSAVTSLFLPEVTASTSFTRFSSPQFNPGTNALADELVQGAVTASYDLFRGGARFSELSRSRSLLAGARADREQARFDASLAAEAAFYDVLAGGELERVARERVRRAEEQLAVARARVVSGAAVRSDSLQLVLELTRARVELLRQETALRVARLELGRRVGVEGPVDAVPLASGELPGIPLDEERAVALALRASPRVVAARERASAAESAAAAARSGYLPEVSLFGQWSGFDDGFPPTGTSRTLWGVQVSVPLWDGARREIGVARARTGREVAAAARADAERAARRDAVEAYQGFRTARASAELASTGVAVARENLQVQQDRYRSGTTTIIDLLTAQVDLAGAEAEHVQARYATWLALARLETVLGRRLSPDRRAGAGEGEIR